MSRKNLCKFDACDNEVRYPILGVCATCYSGLRLWAGRSVAQKRTRAQQYTRMQERMDYLMDGTGLLPGYRAKQKRLNEQRRNARAQRAADRKREQRGADK